MILLHDSGAAGQTCAGNGSPMERTAILLRRRAVMTFGRLCKDDENDRTGGDGSGSEIRRTSQKDGSFGLGKSHETARALQKFDPTICRRKVRGRGSHG